MKKFLIITVLLTLCSAKIKINIKTSNLITKTKVEFSGRDFKLVTDIEAALFNITLANLNHGVVIELGKQPDNIFLRDPTPYGNLFEKFNWPQVGRVLTIKSAKIVEFMTENIVLKTHEHINNSTINVWSKIDMNEIVENTARSIWSDKGLPRDIIHNNVSVQFEHGNWSYDDKWRDGSLRSVHFPFGSSKGYVDLKPGQTILSTLSGIKIVMLIEIEYIAKLVGTIVLDYDELYGKYHFYSPSVEKIMRVAKLKNEIVTKEFLEVRFYTKPNIKVLDEGTGEELNVEVRKRHWRKKEEYVFRKPVKPASNKTNSTNDSVGTTGRNKTCESIGSKKS